MNTLTSNLNDETDDPFKLVCIWLESALKCNNFHWDQDQHDAATECLRMAQERLRGSHETGERYPCACPEGSCGRLMKYPNQYCRSLKALQQPPVLDRKVTVCDHCECACCWQGEFMCDEAKGAGTVDRSIRELLSHAHPRESCEYWFKSPNNGAIDQSGLDELRRYLEAKANAKGK